MRKELPASPNLDHLKSQAKDLLEAFRRRDREALERVRASLPAARGATDAQLAARSLALHDAQSVIAREHGFDGWNALREHVAEVLARAPSPEMMRALLHPHLTLPLPPEVLRAAMAAAGARVERTPLPATLPLLPLRNAVLTVGAVAPLNIGRPSSQAALAAATRGGGLLAVFAQRHAPDESPTLADLHAVGCAASLVTTVATPAQGTWVVVRGLQWIRLEAIERDGDGLVARVAPFAVHAEETAEVKQLELLLRDQVRAFATRLPDGQRLLAMTKDMTALELADVTIANVPCSVDDKARYATEPSLKARLATLLALLSAASSG